MESLPATFVEDPFLGRGTLAVTHIESTAGSRNAIPDSCTFVVDRRLTAGETEAGAVAQVQDVIRRQGVRGEVRLAEFEQSSYTGYLLRGMEYYPAWVMPEDHPLVDVAMRAVSQVTGERPVVGTWDFSTDGAYPSAGGSRAGTMGVASIPTIGIGPGDETLAHTADEHICLADCSTAAQVYAQLAVDLLGKA